ncbi:unnamed protein product [Rhizophagus irregularis]|uniref:Uncharacterized protein n=1 Tax=Rhizophagus irregularis TaxID=588596 RepID=A0A915YZC6_9GLOM|nr:unnamed protein product [Rhizophagus irregularis]
MEIDEERVLRLAQEGNRKRVLRARNKNQLQDRQINEPNDNEHIQREDDNRYMHVRSTTSTTISEDDHKSDLFQSIQVEQRSASTTISTTLTPITQNSNFHWTNLTLYRHPD